MLELGAGSGLPSLVCAIHGASRVVVTDYPDADLIENLRYNVAACELLPDCNVIQAEASSALRGGSRISSLTWPGLPLGNTRRPIGTPLAPREPQ